MDISKAQFILSGEELIVSDGHEGSEGDKL